MQFSKERQVRQMGENRETLVQEIPVEQLHSFVKYPFRLDYDAEFVSLMESINSHFQGVAGMNFTDAETPYTRIVEHKHFEFSKGNDKKTVITREYSSEWKQGDEPYYPVNDDVNTKIYAKYKELADKDDKIHFGGRLGTYQYMDMDKVIALALKNAENEAD